MWKYERNKTNPQLSKLTFEGKQIHGIQKINFGTKVKEDGSCVHIMELEFHTPLLQLEVVDVVEEFVPFPESKYTAEQVLPKKDADAAELLLQLDLLAKTE